MNVEAQNIEWKIDRDVAYIKLVSPPLNILSEAMMNEISGALEEIGADGNLKAVVIGAEGKAFSAGADVGEHQPEKAPAMIAAFSRMFSQLNRLEIPLVIAVDGAALGAGFELAMAADVLIATERSKFGQPEIRLGFFAPLGVAILPSLVGSARAMEITCSGRTYSAAEAREWGLVAEVVPVDHLEETVEALLDDFRKASPLVMRMNVRQVKRSRPVDFEQARLDAERVFLDELMRTGDVKEGIASFFEKRRPEWKNS